MITKRHIYAIYIGTPILLLIVLAVMFRSSPGTKELELQVAELERLDFSEVGFAPEAITLAPGVHLLGKVVPGNAYAVETDAGLVLIDCGIHDDASFVIRQLEELNLDVDSLQKVLITHAHVDHIQGARYLRERTGARIYVGAGDAEVIADGTNEDALFSKYTMTGLKLHPTEVDESLSGGEIVNVGNSVFTAIATPGHSPGSMSYQLKRDGVTMLFTGDTISSMTGEIGTYITKLPPRFRGDANAYLATLEKLRALPAPDLLFPGHTEEDALGQSPKMNAALWAELLGRGVRDVQATIGHHEIDGADFLGEKPFRIHGPLHFLGRFRGHGVYAIINDKQIFLFDAPGGRGFVDFVEERLTIVGVEIPSERHVLFTNCDGRTTANLGNLVEQLGFNAVVPRAAIDAIKRRVPDDAVFVELEELPRSDWPKMNYTPLSGMGVFPTAFDISIQGKSVVIPGRIPVEPVERSVNELYRELARSGGNVSDLLASIEKLKELEPDIWLPTTIVNDQNANIYDSQWQDVLSKNYNYFEAIGTE